MKPAVLPDVAEVVGEPVPERAWVDAPHLREQAAAALPSVLTRELWKYTPLKGFLDDVAGAAADAAQPALVGADQPAVRATAFADLNQVQQDRVRLALGRQIEAARHPVAGLSLLRARGGWLVEVSGRAERPLELHYPGSGIAPVVVLLDPHAELTLVEHADAGDFLAQVTHLDLGPGARLSHHRAVLHDEAAHYALLNARLDRDAGYRLNQSCVGGERRRLEVHVVLDGAGASAELTGAYLVEHRRHLDQQLVVEHRQGHTTSRQKFHGIGAGKGRSVFNGRIHIHPHAPGSDAQLSNKNLALSPEAEMNTKPELEIYTDDVRCAHGATVGQLSVEALFYLTARGITETEARRLLAHGFVRECLEGPLAEGAAVRFREALA